MTERAVLIVDDEPDIRELLEIALGRMGIATDSVPTVSGALQQLDERHYDLCLTDMRLPDGNGIGVVEHIATHHPETPVAMMTAFGNMDTAITALKAGAFDFVQKPVDLAQLRTLVTTALNLGPGDTSAEEVLAPLRLLGHSESMNEVRGQIDKLARSQAPVYISGESGSGKEVVARAIHARGPRAEAPFIPVNCGAIPAELMEGEFFGHVKGSFTGAVADREGLFQAAAGGTLFLDEVADLPAPMQVKLLRAIQEKAVRPVGGASEVPIDVRVLSATHKDLSAQVAGGAFRQDLYYRLNVIELNVPPLRERRDDIPEFVHAILGDLASEYGTDVPTVDPAAMETLLRHPFPGNVRQLQNALERAYTLCDNQLIRTQDLQLEPVSSSPPSESAAEPELQPSESLEDFLERVERSAISKALEQTRWNRTAAARRLGITFRALRYRLRKLGMDRSSDD